MIPDLTGVDPDDAFSTVPYEKGHTFLWYLETLLGGSKVFEPFLKAYIDKFKYKCLPSDTFKSFLLEYFNRRDVMFSFSQDKLTSSKAAKPVVILYSARMSFLQVL